MAASAAAAASSSSTCLLLLFVLSTLCFPSSSSSKVTLSLYYETLCPFCSNFMVNYLPKIFDDGLISIVDLDLVPYGNARVGFNDSISCQHGPYECLLNTVEACAISTWPDVQEHFKFIYCIERLVYEHKYASWESCYQTVGVDSQAIVDCYNSGYGQKLELRYAAQTDALQPHRKYVPWVVVNGQPLYDDYKNLEIYICKAYDGELPKACKGLLLTIPQAVKEKQEDLVCRTNEIFRSSPITKKDEVKISMLI